MLSLSEIMARERQAEIEARIDGKEPYTIESQEELNSMPPFPFPCLGDYIPSGWKAVDDPAFVDSTGMGADDEPAMSVAQFIRWLQIGSSYAITQVGQFQLYVQRFERV